MKTDPIIYRASGTQESVSPENEKQFTSKELRAIVGGYIQLLFFLDGRVMVVNEDGRLGELPPNVRATEIIRRNGKANVIFGDALVCSSKLIK
jgi:ribosomal protein L36